MKAKRIFLPTALAAAVLLPGCNVMTITNLTPETVNANPSGIYTLSVRVEPESDTIRRSSIQTHIVIDGEPHLLESSELGSFVYDFDYTMPEGRDKAKYYYEVDYKLVRWDAVSSGPQKVRSKTSDIYTLDVAKRYPITLEAGRAPIGTAIAILGRGFTRADEVVVGGQPAVTRYISQNTIEFIVPALATNTSYPVEVRNGSDAQVAGMLRVDPGTPLRVVPPDLDLRTGETRVLVFAVDFAAPDDGLAINITTDIPDSIIMPEVVIPAGERTVNVPVEGGTPGRGSIFVSMRGTNEMVVPVTVR